MKVRKYEYNYELGRDREREREGARAIVWGKKGRGERKESSVASVL